MCNQQNRRRGFPKTVARAAEQVRAPPIARGVAHNIAALALAAKGADARDRSLRKTAQNKRFPTLKKKDEAPPHARLGRRALDSDAPARPSQRMNQIVCTLHAIDATTPSTRRRAGPGRRQAAQNDLREQPEVGPGRGQEGQGLLQQDGVGPVAANPVDRLLRFTSPCQ